MAQPRTDPPEQPLSETTRLLLEAPNGSGTNERPDPPGGGSLELGNVSPREPVAAGGFPGPFPPSPRGTRGRGRPHKIALMGILAIAVVAFRFLGPAGTVATTTGSHGGGNHDDDDDDTIRKVSLIGSSRWDDDTHHAWEKYVANEKGNPRYEADPGAVAGGLLGATTATTTKTRQTGAGASASTTTTSTATTTTTTTAAIAKNKAADEHAHLRYFNQTSAFSRLDPLESDFFHYQQGWEAQITQALCAVATSAALLNSLRYVERGFELPQDPVYEPFPWATQKELLASAQTNNCVREALGGRLANAEAVFHMGLGLTMVPRLLNCFLGDNGYLAKGHAAVDDDDDDGSFEEATKEMVVGALKDPSSRVVYNYDRGGIGQGPPGHGHWSPLGGYHEPTDSFLVMDVAKYKHPMVWVPWKDLWAGASTLDSCGETLSLKKLNWTAGLSQLKEYLASRCIPGQRGFVVVEPVP